MALLIHRFVLPRGQIHVDAARRDVLIRWCLACLRGSATSQLRQSGPKAQVPMPSRQEWRADCHGARFKDGTMRQHFFRGILVFAILSLVTAQAEAQNTIGGHFGVLFPLVTHADGTTKNISDDFTVGFPVGITVRRNETFAFDLEFVPLVQNEPLDVDLTVHPGVLWGLPTSGIQGLSSVRREPAVVGFHAAGQLRVRRRWRREFALRRTGGPAKVSGGPVWRQHNVDRPRGSRGNRILRASAACLSAARLSTGIPRIRSSLTYESAAKRAPKQAT